MKIYVTHSSGFDFKNELYQPLRNSELNNQHQITLPHENSSEPFSSKDFMKECDLILSEVSHPSTGQGIELGWANFYDIPILCIFKNGTKPSDSLKTVSDKFIEYENSEDMIQKVVDYLSLPKLDIATPESIKMPPISD